jgi:fumarate reductase subunit C
MTAKLYLLQRLTALILAPMVITHLLLIIVAVRNGLSAAEILNRTQGSAGWALFYGLFVICAAVHGGIGLRNILVEWTRLGGKVATIMAHSVMLLLLLLGLRAVWAVIT